MNRRSYLPPAIRRVYALRPHSSVLAASVSDTTTVRTMGHEVESYTIGPGNGDHTFEAPDWGSNWGN